MGKWYVTDYEDENKKRGIHVIGEKKVLVAKVKQHSNTPSQATKMCTNSFQLESK